MSEELKPCPFCGHHEIDLAYTGEAIPADEFEEAWEMGCCRCGATPISDPVDKAAAIRAWNARAHHDSGEGNAELIKEINEAVASQNCTMETSRIRLHDLLSLASAALSSPKGNVSLIRECTHRNTSRISTIQGHRNNDNSYVCGHTYLWCPDCGAVGTRNEHRILIEWELPNKKD